MVENISIVLEVKDIYPRLAINSPPHDTDD